MPHYQTSKEAADYLRRHEVTLARWRTTGEGPRFIKRGGRIYYRTQDLDAWMTEGEARSTSEYPDAA